MPESRKRILTLKTALVCTLLLWCVPYVGVCADTSRVAPEQPTPQADTVTSLPGIEIQTSVDKAEAYIGDLITYTLTIIHDSTIELIPPPLGANLGAFDVKDYKPDMQSTLPDGRIKSTSEFILSTFTTGDYVIPPIPLAFRMPDSSQKILLSEAVPIKIKSLLAEGADTVDIRPLKPPYEFKRDLTPYYIWGGVILLVLLAAVFFFWWRRKKRKGEEEAIDLRPPWEIAYERLARLQQEGLTAQGKHKLYYLELTEIARQYLERIYEINVLDMTTEEFLERFREVALPEGLYEDLGRFLRHADLVKFAKLVPEEERARSDFEFVHRMIAQVREDFERRQAMTAAAEDGSASSGDTRSNDSGGEVS